MAKRTIPVQLIAGLGGILLLALLLRTWGLGWGIPSEARYYPYHPDESVVLDATCHLNPLWGQLAPGFYSYGSFYMLLTRLAHDLAAPFLGWGPVPRYTEPFNTWVADFARLLWTGRWVTVVLGVLTVLETYALGTRLYNRRTGILAALFLAASPLPVLLGHYMTVDVPAASLTTLALLLAADAATSEDPRRKIGLIVGAAFIAGLATGTKYNAVTALLPLAVPVWQLLRGGPGRAALAPAGALLAFGIAFLIATPGALLQTDAFLDQVRAELDRNKSGQGLVFIATAPTAIYHLTISLPIAMEWPLYLLALAGTGWAARQRRLGDWILLLFVIASFLALIPAERKFLRYVTPLIPPLVLFAARLADETWTRFGRFALPVALAGALASTIAHLGVMAAPDARDQAAEYLRAHASGAEVVALASDPWFWTPPIDPSAGCVKVSRPYGGPPIWDRFKDRPELFTGGPFAVLAPRSNPPAGPLSLEQVQRYRPKYIVVTDYEYEDPERIHRADPGYKNNLVDLLEALPAAGYRVEREIRPRPSLLGFSWWSKGTPPHDWRYYMPTVRIYATSSASPGSAAAAPTR